MPEERKCMVIVRIRGTIKAARQVRETLKMLHLKRNNYAVLIDDRPSYLGMLKTTQNFITWGEASEETVKILIKKRGRLAGNKKITEEYLQKLGYKSVEELGKSVFNCQVEYWKLPRAQPFFGLHPPTKGFKGKIKKGYDMGGELGYRGDKINELVERMI